MSVVQSATTRPRRLAMGARWPILLLALAFVSWQVLQIQSSGITLFVDEAYYWLWSKELAWGYYSKPPMIAAWIAAGTALLGQNLWGIKYPVLLCYPAAALVLARLVYEQNFAGLAGNEVAPSATRLAPLATAACFLCAPLVMLVGLFASTDALLLLGWSVAALFAWRATVHDTRGAWWGLGLAVGLGLLSKYTMVVFGVSMLAWLVHDAAARRRWWVARARVLQAVALAIVTVLPHLMWSHAQGWPTVQHTAEITAPGSGIAGWSGLSQFALAQVLVPGWLAWALAWRRMPVAPANAIASIPSATRMAWALTWPILAVGLLQAARAGAEINWSAPAVVGLSLLAGPRMATLGPRGMRWAVVALALQVTLCAVVLHMRDLARAADHPRWAAVDLLARMRGWDRALDTLRPVAVQLLETHGRLQLLSQDRTALSHAAWQWRDLNPQVLGWRPAAHVSNQFELKHPLQAGDRGPWLYVGAAPPAEDFLARFKRHGVLGSAHVTLGPGRTVALYAQRVDDFIGYGRP